MRIVAAPRDENDILAEDRARLSVWAPSNGWSYIEYGWQFERGREILQSLLPFRKLPAA